MSMKTDNFTAPPCAYVPEMTGDASATLRQLRVLATTVCPTCDPNTFRTCRSDQTADQKWRVRAGVVRQDMLVSQ